MSAMIVVSSRIPVSGGQEGEFAERLYDRVGLVERHPGFVRLEVLRPERVALPGRSLGGLGGADCYVVLTYWARAEDFVAWTQSDDFRRAHAQRAAADPFAGQAAFEVYRLVQTTEGPGAAAA
jgi:heme-degrading monooxygenase HmoA